MMEDKNNDKALASPHLQKMQGCFLLYAILYTCYAWLLSCSFEILLFLSRVVIRRGPVNYL